MKKIVKKIVAFFGKYILYIFYNKKYINSAYFNSSDKIIWALRTLWFQKILGFNKHFPLPVAPTVRISHLNNLVFDISDLNNLSSPGCYFQNFNAKIYLGKGTYIAPNVGLITSNHDLNDLNKHSSGSDIKIGEKCWIGMNSVILPGVELGDNTIVGAGSVVTKSFKEGNQVIAGNPAKILKKL